MAAFSRIKISFCVKRHYFITIYSRYKFIDRYNKILKEKILFRVWNFKMYKTSFPNHIDSTISGSPGQCRASIYKYLHLNYY